MNLSLDDRHRSVRRFLIAALGSPPWTLRTERQPVADDERPVGVVEASTPVVTLRSRTSIPQGNLERSQTFGIALYPAFVGTTAREARLAAQAAAQQLDQAIAVGLVNDDESMLCPPEMISVYDYDGVPVKGDGRAGPADPYGWLRVEDYPVRAIQDPDDPQRWTITCDLRVSWEQAGRDRPPAETAESFGGEFVFDTG